MSRLGSIVTFCLLMAVFTTSYAQLCSGSLGDPVFKVDFGAGTNAHAGQLPSGITNYNYSTADFPADGSYTIENATTGNIWWNTRDHTGNAGGYMMVVNASDTKTAYFYKTAVNGLCPGTTFRFAAWIANLLKGTDNHPPDITFTIFSATDMRVLATTTTGPIPLTTNGLVWKQFGLDFTTPAGVTDVILQMTNNSDGGIQANDLALDDITFSPCGPLLITNFVAADGSKSPMPQVDCTNNLRPFTLTAEAVTTPYANPVYQWQVNTGSGWVNIPGATSATYLARPTVVGTYKYRVLSSEAGNAGNTKCQVASPELSITVQDNPTANFTYTTNTASCLLNAVDFKDTSPPSRSGTRVTSWAWDFDDNGATSTVQNPSHTFSTPGVHNVKLTVSNGGGTCTDVMSKPVTITPKLLADFTPPPPSCSNVPLTFIDKSSTSEGTLTNWTWNPGDGSGTSVLHTGETYVHTYTKSGTFTVSLQVQSTTGCTSDVVKHDVVIKAGPAVDFSFPDACTGEVVQFTNKTTADANIGALSYQWDFGDQNASAGNNTSTAVNPQHLYGVAGVYKVTLKVSAQNGCSQAVKQYDITASSTNPGTSFRLASSKNACVSDSVGFVDQSFPLVGRITKLEWHFDADNPADQSVVITKNQLRSDRTYRHLYALPNPSQPKTFHVILYAYTGQTCSEPYSGSITVFPSPVATISPAGPITLCEEDGPMTFTATPNVPGAGRFSGVGITTKGVFDPAISGPGEFTISYFYTADNGACEFATSFKVTVSNKPVIRLATTAAALEGGQLTLNPKVTGDDLKYSWTPTTGISDPKTLNPVFSPADNITYALTVTDNKTGCAATAKVTVSVLKTPVVPNAFTPNNDGINDTWEIKYLNTYPNATIEVFNRYGLKVFSSNGYPVPWDGKVNGASLPFGVYYYIINPRSGRPAITGSLTIIK